jgi:hypothetical protein
MPTAMSVIEMGRQHMMSQALIAHHTGGICTEILAGGGTWFCHQADLITWARLFERITALQRAYVCSAGPHQRAGTCSVRGLEGPSWLAG